MIDSKFEYVIEKYTDEPFKLKLVHSADKIEPFNYILNKFNCSDIEPLKWKNKYNGYSVCENEPFCKSGYYLIRNIKFEDEAHAQYFIYLLDKHINNIKQLSLCYTNSDTEE